MLYCIECVFNQDPGEYTMVASYSVEGDSLCGPHAKERYVAANEIRSAQRRILLSDEDENDALFNDSPPII